MPGFVCSNFCFVKESKADVVQALEQADPSRVINGKVRYKTLVIFDLALLQIDSQLVARGLLGTTAEFPHLVFAKDCGEYPVLQAVVGEDVSEGWSNHSAEAEVLQRPNGMFAGRTTAEVFACHQNAGTRIAR